MGNYKRLGSGALVVILLLTAVFLAGCDREEEMPAELEVDLYFSDQEAMNLIPEKRVVDTEDLYYNTLRELIAGPSEDSLLKTIPEGTEVEDIDLAEGQAEVSFNQALSERHWGGSSGELMTVYSIVNTLTQFDEIDEVKILIEGQEVESLVGHMDLTDFLVFNEDLVEDK